jgi:hypothetical protein
MYDIRQFKPALYVLIILGVSGFALAWESTGLWVLAVGAICLNAWLLKTNRFRPMPRLVANATTLLGVLVLFSMLRRGADKMQIIGEFLVLLQIIKLYEQRANRDYAQLLILSLLLMVSSSISTASVFFGIMLIIYLFLSLYCCLLFHLKVETDYAKRAIGVAEQTLTPAALRQSESYLSRSMRRITILMSLFAVVMAILTFLFFPRGSSAGLLGPTPWQPSRTLTGFSTSVNFQTVARITQNSDQVAWVKVTRAGAPYSDVPLMLRGLSLDHYSGNGDADGGSAYQWTRTILDPQIAEFSNNDFAALGEESPDDLLQEITLYPTGTNVLFAIGGITAFKPNDSGAYRYSPQDQVMQTIDPITQPLRYQILSSGKLTANLSRRRNRRTMNIDPQIEQFARRPEVCGTDAQGPLAARRDKDLIVSPLDAAIAHNIEVYLHSNFSYTLDLTDAARIKDRDPMVAFLYDLKRGHCEYFAGAMTLMCQSLGMQARMVVGFKCDDYNALGSYYTVRQSDAHAWVEVLDSTGTWQTFDPTSSTLAVAPPPVTLMQKARAFIDFMQYSWANSVVAYNNDNRDNLIQSVDRVFVNSMIQGTDNAGRFSKWLQAQQYSISSNLLGGLIALMIVAVFLAVLWFVFEQWRLRRRARRIGLDALPADQQMRLAKQLGFYDELLLLLERHQIIRPPHLTPLEFSDSLTYLPIDAFDSVQKLTDVFYIVRYGHRELSTTQQRQMIDVLSNVESSLGAG